MSSQQSGSNALLVKETLLDDTVKILTGEALPTTEKKRGIEVEMPFVRKKDLKPIPFSGKRSITAVFNALCKKGAWTPGEVENGKVTSLKGEAGSVTLEPGGQIEFSSAPRTSLTQLKNDIDAYCADMKDIGAKLGVDVIPFGFHPHLSIDACPYISERTRFAALKPVFEAEKGFAAWGQSCSVQVTLDGKAMDDAFAAFKLGLALQPIAAAMCANSPFSSGKDSGYKSWRRQNLMALNSPLYAVPEKLFDPGYTIKDWAVHVLSVPMSFVVRGGKYIPVAAKPFSDMVGKHLPELSHLPETEQYLTQKDLLDHTTGIKPEMLLKPNLLLEFRAADLGPSPQHWMALAAFWTGVFYDKEAFKAAQDYVAAWTPAERKSLRENVARDGLTAPVAGKTAQQAALDLIAIARKGLEKTEPEAVCMLDVLEESVKKGVCPADTALKAFKDNGKNMKKTLNQSFLFAPTSPPQRYSGHGRK